MRSILVRCLEHGDRPFLGRSRMPATCKKSERKCLKTKSSRLDHFCHALIVCKMFICNGLRAIVVRQEGSGCEVLLKCIPGGAL